MIDVTPILTFAVALVFTLFILSVPVLIVVYIVGMHRRANRLLYEWAGRNGYRIIESEHHQHSK